MAEGKSNKALWAIGCGVLGLVGTCCVGAAALGWYGYQQAEREQQRMLDEWRRAEEEMRRAEEEARRDEARYEEERARIEEMIRPPPSLMLAPRPNRRDRSPRAITATVTRVLGAPGVEVGDGCRFPVQVLDAEVPAGYWCRAMVECSGVRLYGQESPGVRNGFFHCELFQSPAGVAGEDLASTYDNSDPILQIDTRSGQLLVADDQTSFVGGAFRVEARITAVE